MLRAGTLATLVTAASAAGASTPATLIAPERVQVEREPTIRIRIVGAFRECTEGVCGESRIGAVELDCGDDSKERCEGHAVALTAAAKAGQCVMVVLDTPVIVTPPAAAIITPMAWRAERPVVPLPANDPLCAHARGPRDVARVNSPGIAGTHAVERTPGPSRSYARWMLMNDGISVVTMPLVVGIGGYFLAGPILHWSQGNAAKGFASLVLRVGMPIVGALVSSIPCMRSNSCNSDIIGFAFFGAIAGALGAVAIDAGALAYGTEDAKKVRIAPIASPRVLGLALSASF